MGFSENDLPRFDVTFGQVKEVEPSTENREPTTAEWKALKSLLAATEVWDEALSSGTVRELAEPANGHGTEAGEPELTAIP